MTEPAGWSPVTQPIVQVGQGDQVAPAERKLATVLTIRLVVGVVGAAAAVVAAVLLFRAGRSVGEFGPFMADGELTSIDRYTGPWIVAAAGALLVAGLLLVSATADGVRAGRLRSGKTGRAA